MLTKIIKYIACYTNNHYKSYKKMIELIPASENTINKFINEKQIFFIVSTGRTATHWLSHLLNLDEKAIVVHEPVPVETWAHKDAVKNRINAERYILDFRKKELYLRLHSLRRKFNTYGEVNGILRRHIEPIEKCIPNVKLIHLVRNGKDVVRSVISRQTYSGKHPVYYNFSPPKVDDWSSNWEKLSEFEKTCWLWQWENKYMREHINLRAYFEEIITSYASFKKQILNPIGLSISKEIWQQSINKSTNSTQTYKMNLWEDWDSSDKEIFADICADEMQRYGYVI